MDPRRPAAGEPDASAADADARRVAPRDSHEAPPSAAEPVETEASEPEGSSTGIVGHLQSLAEPMANAVEPFVDYIAGPMADAIGSVIEAASFGWSGRQATVERRMRRQAREPLPSLYNLYPEARRASPRELEMRFVPVEDVRGTAVAGPAQRGGDFLPLKDFRGDNWESRWQRIRGAVDRLQPLPPVDLIKYDGDYWVVDGHNRVAAVLYTNGAGLDAMVTELVRLDGRTSESPRNVLSYLGETGEMRAAAHGHRPAMGMRQVEQQSADEAASFSGAGTSASADAPDQGGAHAGEDAPPSSPPQASD
jgi:hypothetical protein